MHHWQWYYYSHFTQPVTLFISCLIKLIFVVIKMEISHHKKSVFGRRHWKLYSRGLYLWLCSICISNTQMQVHFCEAERTGRKWWWSVSCYYVSTCLEWPRYIKKIYNKYNLYKCQDVNWAPAKYKSESSPFETTCLAWISLTLFPPVQLLGILGFESQTSILHSSGT